MIANVSSLFADPVRLTSVTGIALQVGRPFITLVTIPMLTVALGTEGLGLWMITLSFTGILFLLNTGLSIALVTFVARERENPDHHGLNCVISAATLIAFGLAVFLSLLLLPIVALVDWARLLNANEIAVGDEVTGLMFALVVLTVMNLAVVVPRQVMLGRLHGYISHISDFVGSVLGAVALYVALLQEVSLAGLALAFLAPPPICMLIVGLTYLKTVRLTLFSRHHLSREILSKLGADSLRMLGYQTSFAVSSQSDILLVGIFFGPAASAVFGLAQRVFAFPIMLTSMVNHSQWPYLARLDVEDRLGELRRYFLKSLFWISMAGLMSGVFVFFIYDALLDMWLGQTLETDNLLLMGMVVWVVVAASVNTLDSLLRARNETKFLMRAMMAMCVVNLSATITLLPQIGPAGAIWGTVFGYVFCLFLPYCLRLYSALAAASDAPAKDAEL